MRNIIVVECISTGVNFIEDIINRGYNPVVLHLKIADTKEGKCHENLVYSEYKRIAHDFDMIFEHDSFEETVKEVRKYDPLLIVPGNEKGVVLATRLSHELGLLTNPIENLDVMTLKDEMQNRLAERGLRSIRGKVIRSLDEAIEFYDTENLKEVVVKPVYSSCSSSVRICFDRDELIDSINCLFDDFNCYGDENTELLVQERIDGVEYIVNTVSHNGIHRITLIWKYNKVRTSEGAIIYDSCETVNKLSIGEAEMVEYAYDVADALGIQYGPVHGEYMIDENGPVLIEVNCRPCGGNMPAEFLDRISGQHETDSILDSYLKPERFYEELKRRYELYEHGALKFFIVPHDIIANSSSMVSMSIGMKSYYDSTDMGLDYGKKHFRKTIDLHTSGGYLFLVHEDKSEVDNNLNLLRTLEKEAFSLILSDDCDEIPIRDDEEYLTEIRPLVENVEKYGSGLLVTDQFVEGAKLLQKGIDQIDEVKGKFDFIIVNLNRSLKGLKSDEKTDILLKLFLKVRNGGHILIPESSYQFMAGGRRGVEGLINVLDYTIEVPPNTVRNMIVASRR